MADDLDEMKESDKLGQDGAVAARNPAVDCLSFAAVLRKQFSESQKIAFVGGNFNVVHPGHLRLLKFASENSDLLIVGVNPDGLPEITVPTSMRVEALEAITIVDHVILLDQPLDDFIRALRPDLVVKGKEHSEHFNSEEDLVAEYGGRLMFGSGDVTFSSRELIEHERFWENRPPLIKSEAFAARHGFDVANLEHLVEKFLGMRVVVLGDLILDSYVICDPVGMSQEDPTVVIMPREERLFVGGAGIVASNARQLGADVNFITTVGDDERARFGLEELNRAGVETHFIVDSSRPTTLKKRYRAHGKTLLRVNELRDHSIGDDLVAMFLSKFDDIADQTDLVLFSDFNYGCLPQQLIDAVADRCRERKIMMAADSQASSQYGNIGRFKGMTLITPTEREARLAVTDFEAGLATLASKLQMVAGADHVVITLGSDGVLVQSQQDGAPFTDRLPAFNREPQDVAGAGDALFALASLAVCAGASIWEGVFLGSVAAGFQVGRVGNDPLSSRNLVEYLQDYTA